MSRTEPITGRERDVAPTAGLAPCRAIHFTDTAAAAGRLEGLLDAAGRQGS